MCLCYEPCGTDPDGPAAQQVVAVIVTTAETHEQSTNYTVTDPDGPITQQVDVVIVTTAETHEQSTIYTVTDAGGPVDAVIVTTAETQEQSSNNTVTAPTSVSSSLLSYADVTSHTTTNAVLGENELNLSGQQRRRTRRGFVLTN